MTDGLDGLAGGCAALAFMGMSIAVLPINPGKYASLILITVYSSLIIYSVELISHVQYNVHGIIICKLIYCAN